jgi:DNA-binding Xre family transcriptional regulator
LGWLDRVHEADRERTRRAWLHSLEAKTSYATKYRLLCRDGVMRWFIARNEPVFDGRGALIEWFGVAFDISDLKEFDETFFSKLENTGPTGALVRSARALLDWSINDLANKSGVSISSIRRLESGEANGARNQTMDLLMKALSQAGIEFFQVDDKGTFVRLRKDKSPLASSMEPCHDSRV